MENCGEVKIKWNHHGVKHRFSISHIQLERDIVFATDKELRDLISQNRRIKIYTSAQKQSFKTYSHRSQFVPLDLSSHLHKSIARLEQNPPPPYSKSFEDAITSKELMIRSLRVPPPCYSTPSCYTRSLLYVSPPEPLIIRSLLFSPSLVAATATALNFPCAMVVATYGVECAAQVFFH
ncbi:unnamed protein product [Dracunculus medinensis]|uniref:Ovule protein n=1 Tax=Dracunculus medinensis TaxID=318479 RepID=A0A0N4UNP8_DRAME|nr:unnamed protein product [Dracunculus medinensis]